MGNKLLISIKNRQIVFSKDTFRPAVGNLELECCNMKLLLHRIYIMIPN